MRFTALAGTAAATALAVRVVRSRHQRFLHPDGRSFTGSMKVLGTPFPVGSAALDHPATYPVTVRISKGAGTRAGRPDVLGVAVRLPGDRPLDLLLSTSGTGRFSRHIPMLRRGFDTFYGSILAYRTGTGRKIYLAAFPDPDGIPLGRSLESVTSAAASGWGALLLAVATDGGELLPVARLLLGAPLPVQADAALAFDPIRNTSADLHPTGAVHGVRAFAYRAGQRWRGVRPAAPAPERIARSFSHR